MLFFNFSFKEKIKKPARITRKSIKFSAFAMFPSMRGSAKRTPKIDVESIAILLLPPFSWKSFFESAKKAIKASIPKATDASLSQN